MPPSDSFGADDTAADTTDRSTRRAILGAGSAALTTGLAGCEHTSEGRVDTSGPTPSVTITDARVVQYVENSQLTGSSNSLDDPPIVAGENATVLFDVEAEHVDQLPEEIPYSVIATGANVGEPRFLYKSDIEAITNGADPAAVFHQRVHSDGDEGGAPPVFEMPANPGTIEITLEHNNVNTNSVTLQAGPNADFEVASKPTLRVGFVELKHAGSTGPRVHGHGNQPHEHTGSVDWGNDNGEATFYRRSADSSMEYFRRVFPGDVVGYRHEDPHVCRFRDYYNWAEKRDAEDSHVTVKKAVGDSTFPNDGTVYEGRLSRSEAIDRLNADQGGGIDVVVQICPQGTVEGHQDYLDAHKRNAFGVCFNDRNVSVSADEATDAGEDVFHAHISAQEVTHQFARTPYSSPFSRTGNDPEHVDGSMRSIGYDLHDGTFSVLNDWSVADGNFTNGSPQTNSGQPVVSQLTSYMSYVLGQDHWTDSRIHRYLIEGDYGFEYNGGGSPAVDPVGGAAAGGGLGQEGGTQPVISVYGSVDDEGRVEVYNAATYLDTPVVTESEEAVPEEATPVEITLEDPEGEPLTRTVVGDRVAPTHHESTDRDTRSVTASLPFPTEGVSISVVRDGAETRVNPIVAPVRNRLSDVRLDAFVEGTDTFGKLTDTLALVDELMAGGEYDAAATTLAEEFIGGVEDGIDDYEAYANEPRPDDFVELTERLIERLRTIGPRQTPTPRPAEATEIGVDPSATYLHTAADDPAADATPIPLGELGIEPGSEVTLTRVGSYTKGGPGGQGLTAVFSASSELLAPEELDRLPDAIDAGEDYETSPTYYGDEQTDIPEDFLVSTQDGSDPSVTVTVPAEASHLFVAAIDNLYADNTDEDDDFGVEITPV